MPEALTGDAPALPRWRVFPPVALGVVMATLDASVVTIALPTLQRQFAAEFTTVEWVVLAYAVTITGLLLSAGRLADLSGRRRVYGAGVALFTLASAACGAAPGLGALIAARVVQGIGAALVSANGSALLVAAFPPEERGKVLGAFGAMVGVGLAVGSPLGGIVIAHASWRWLFFANLPLGAITLALLRARVPADVRAPGGPRLDLAAAAAWCATLVALMLALSRGSALGWARPPVLALFALALVALAAFAAIERRAAHPMLPVRILLGPLGAAVSLTLVSQALAVAVGLHLPMYLEDVLGYDAQRTGAWNTILPLAALVCAPLAGALSDRVGVRVLTTAGLALATLGCAVMAGLGVSPEPARLVAGLGLVGAGLGLFAVPNASALLSLVPRAQLGIASGLQGTTRNLGFSSGAALMGAMMASGYARHSGHVLAGAGSAMSGPGFAAATRDAYRAMAAAAALATVLAAVQDRRPPAGD